MKVDRLIHLIIFLLALNRITIGGEIDYFRHVEIDNHHTINTRYQISPDEADTINCFKVEYDGKERIEKITYMKDGRPANQDEGKWSRFFIKREKNSEAWWYEDIGGNLCFADTNLALTVYELKDDSIPVTLTNFDAQGNIVEDSAGVAKYIFDTDQQDHVIIERRLNGYGDTITDKLGYYETRYRYDEDGNGVEIANHGPDGKLSSALSGSAIMRALYDSLENPIEIRFFDESMNLVVDKLLNAAIAKFTYDKNGYINSMIRYDTKNRLMPIDDDPWPRLEADYSDRGNPIEFRYYGQDEILKLRIRNNQQRKLTEQCFFGPDGELRNDRIEGYARYIANYNGDGEMIEESYQDPDSQLIMPNVILYAHLEIDRDKNGFPSEARYYDSHHILTEARSGCAIVQYDRDNEGRIIAVRSFGADGKLKEDTEVGIAMCRIKYDSMGNEIEKSSYGADGRLKNGIGKEYSISRFKYDNNGRLLEFSIYGPDEKPVIMRNAGYAMARTKYDRDGNRLEDSFYGTDGKLVNAPGLDFARAQRKYDKNGNLIEDSHFGAQNEPIVWSKGGYFKSKRKYDSGGRLIEACFYEVDGTLMERKGSDVAVIRFKYNDDGKMIEKIMFDKNMNVSSKTKSFEDLGR